MRALVALMTAASLGGCAMAVKHPAPTIGITAFVLAEGMCEMATDDENLKCLGLSGGIGLGLAGIVALAQLLGGPGDTVLMGREGEAPLADEPLPVLEKDPLPEPSPLDPPPVNTPAPETTPPPPPAPTLEPAPADPLTAPAN